ncbi:serine/threonine-protein kinase ppk6, partial [Endogone sp. FLAS-F59071]
IPIVKKDNTTSAASLWLKEKKDDSGNPIYIWIFEEIAESLVSVNVNQSGVIRDIDGSVEELYGYAANELVGRSIDVMIPAWAKLRVGDSGYCELNEDEETASRTESSPSAAELRIPDQRLLNIAEINRVKFFGSKTKFGACFPIITKVSGPSAITTAGTVEGSFTVKIISIPTIAGLVTIHKDGMIQSCNVVFAKYLFGFTPKDLVEMKKIGELLPNFPLILEEIISEPTLQVGSIINNTLCRKALRSALANIAAEKRPLADAFRMTSLDNAKKADENRRSSAPSLRRASSDVAGSLPSIMAIHRDSTEFDVQVQMRIVESAQETLYALWITFDRVATFVKVGHPVSLDSGMMGLRSAPQTPRAGHGPQPNASHSTPSSRSSMSFDDDLGTARMPADSKPSPSSASTSSAPSNVILSPPTPAVPFGMPQTEARLSETKPITIPTDPKALNIPKNIIPVTPPATATPPEELRSYSALTNSKRIEDYEIVNSLGQGAYGLVKLAYHKHDPFKSRILVDCWTRDRHLGLIPLEIHVLHTLRRVPHQNIVNMTDYFEDDEHYYVEMDLHGAGMDLFDYIELNNNINEREIKTIFRQVVEAVRHLHVNKIVHRDIKDENVILDENGTVQLIDFGSAAYLREGRKYDTFCGTLDYAAPEVLQGKKYDGPPQDIWALGILLYTLIYKENPFYSIDEILARELRIPFVLCEDSIDLIKKMLNRDIEKRPTIDEVLNHPWFYDDI